MVAEHRLEFCESGDVKIGYRRLGAPGATPIVIVHGLSFMAYDWIDIGAAIATGPAREVVAMDARGFGESTWSPSRSYTTPAMAGDIVAVLDALDWRRAILLGHSMGGRLVSYCAAEDGDRVAGLVLIDYSPENAPAGFRRVVESVSGQPNLFESVEAAMRYSGLDPSSPAGKAKRARFEAALRPIDGGYQLKRDLYFRDQFRKIKESGAEQRHDVDMWAVLRGIHCPTLMVRGSRSPVFAPETIPEMNDALPHATLVEVEAGHNIGGENPAGLIAAVRPFLAQL